MHGDVLHHICKFVEVSGRVNIRSKAAADSLIDFRAARTNASNHFIGRGKIVARWFLWVGGPVREDDAGVAGPYDASTLGGIGNQPSEE